MLVSSIGYFDTKKNVVPADNTIKKQPAVKNMSEGFGQYNQKDAALPAPGFMKTIITSIKSLLSKNKAPDSSKINSLIA